MRKFSSAGAKNHFEVLIYAARIAPVAVTKYVKPIVVDMAVEEYEQLTGTSQDCIKPDQRKKRDK